MGLLNELGLPKLPGTSKPAATAAKPSVTAAKDAKPTPQQLADHKKLTDGLREIVPQVKVLAAAKDSRAGDAAKLARETGGLLSWETLEKAKEKYEALKALVTGEAGVPQDSPRRAPKSAAEVSLDDFTKDLGGAIGNIGKMQTAARKMKADGLENYLGKVGEGLAAVKGKADKLVEIVALVRDIQEFQRALQTARGLDLNRDYEAAAVAMGDLANIGGKLAKKATGNGVPGLDAYFTLLQNAGAVWEMGARVRKRREAEWDAPSRDEAPATDAPEEPATKVQKGSTAEIPFASIESFMTDTIDAVEKEVQWMGSVRSNEFPDWSLSSDAFLKAFAEFKALHDKQHKDTVGVYTKGVLSPEYRRLAKEMQGPYATAMKHLEHLQDAVGKRKDISASYEPVLKAMKKVEP